jgi:hypothetical protein
MADRAAPGQPLYAATCALLTSEGAVVRTHLRPPVGLLTCADACPSAGVSPGSRGGRPWRELRRSCSVSGLTWQNAVAGLLQQSASHRFADRPCSSGQIAGERTSMACLAGDGNPGRQLLPGRRGRLPVAGDDLRWRRPGELRVLVGLAAGDRRPAWSRAPSRAGRVFGGGCRSGFLLSRRSRLPRARTGRGPQPPRRAGLLTLPSGARRSR